MKKFNYKTIYTFITIFIILFLVSFSGDSQEIKVDKTFKSLLQYDKNIPLMVKEEKIIENDDFIRFHITYLNNRAETVPAILTLPKKKQPPYEVVFFQHGMGDTKDCNYMISGTEEFVKGGYAVFAIDAFSFGERVTPITKDTSPAVFFQYPYFLREVFRQTVIDIRRGVDYLQTRNDIIADKIYYVGNSMGSLLGVFGVAIEKRFKRAVFIVGGADYKRKMKMTNVMAIPSDEYEVVDPKNYIGLISPRPVFLINATEDSLIPRESGEALFEAAKEPKKQVWLESEHDIPIKDGVKIIINWFNEIDDKETKK